MESIHIDDGFDNLPLPVNPKGTIAQAWLETKDQFPSRHEGVVKKIKERGLQRGIWTTSSIYNHDFADEQPDCLLKDRDGQPLRGDWIRYILDCTPESLAKHVRPYYEGLRNAGYT